MAVTLNGKPVSIAAEPTAPSPMSNSLAKLKGIKPSAEIAETPPLVVIANRIRTRLETSAIEIGKDLLAAKELMAHGEWQPWLKASFGWSLSQAQNFMNLAKDPKSVDFADLPISAQFAIAAPSTPESVKAEVIEEAKTGKKHTVKEVKDKIAAAKPAKPKSAPQPPKTISKPAPASSEAVPEDKAEQAKAKIVKRLRQGLKPEERLDFSALCMTAGWTELAQRLGEDC